MKKQELPFDVNVPSRLKNLQQWMASILTRPIDEDSHMNPISPTGHSMEQEAFDYIIPSPTLRPAQRIELYNQQYWWRLLSVLHDSAPLLLRLFGYSEFNQKIAIPYLTKYSPDHWSLNSLVDRLHQWVEEEYHAEDRQLILDTARIESALNVAFFAEHRPPISTHTLAEKLDQTLSRPVRLQPHVFLFDLRYDLFAFRKTMIKEEVEYWDNQDFPKLIQDRRHYFVLYRRPTNETTWEEVSEASFHFLSLFTQGTTIEQACEWLENQKDEIYSEAGTQLHLWLQQWIAHQWLYFDDSPPEKCFEYDKSFS